jgi:hypothetical protein
MARKGVAQSVLRNASAPRDDLANDGTLPRHLNDREDRFVFGVGQR